MMKNVLISFFTVLLIFCCGVAYADLSIVGSSLNADSAPNKYGSPNWAPWWTATKADIVDGSFTNLQTGTYPGSLSIDPYDEIVYSTMDLGQRLHWIYWLPGETTTSLNNLFEVKIVVDWDGVDYTYDWSTSNLINDSADAGWIQPGSWENYNGGVIGSFGHAWWSIDDDALPFNTNASPYDEVNQADIDALRNEILQYQSYAIGMIRYRETIDSPWQYESLTLSVVPVPGAILLGLLGLGAAGIKLRKFV